MLFINMNKRSVFEIIVIFVILIMGFLHYYNSIFALPLYGDATIHGNIAKDLFLKGPFNFSSTYPPFYLYLLNIFKVIFGVSHANILILVSNLFLRLGLYLLLRRVSWNMIIGMFLVVISIYSTKAIIYSGRLYMEIPLTSMFLYSRYMFYRFFENHEKEYLLVSVFFWVIAALIKQQGLFILLPSYCFILLLGHSMRYVNLKKVGSWFYAFFILFLCTGYGLLYHNEWKIIIGNENNTVLNMMNYVWQSIFNYDGGPNHKFSDIHDVLEYSQNKDFEYVKDEELNKKLRLILEKNYEEGSLRNRSVKTIRPFKFFTSFKDYNAIMNPADYGSLLQYALFVLQLMGIIVVFLYGSRLDRFTLYAILIFIALNTIFFLKNEDQQRYHFYLIYYGLILICFGFKFIARHFNFSKTIYFLGLSVLIVVLPEYALPSFNLVKSQINTQIYASSRWWMKSIMNLWSRLFANTTYDTKIWMNCWNELKYYSSREVSADWQSYFLDEKDIAKYMQIQGYGFIVVLDSQVVNRDKWDGLCKVPLDFKNKIGELYEEISLTWISDVHLYRIVYD